MPEPLLRRFTGWFAGRWRERSPSANLLLWGLRGVFGASFIGIAVVVVNGMPSNYDMLLRTAIFLAIVATGFVVVTLDVLVKNKQITTVSALYFGLLLGLLLGSLFSTALEPFIS